MFQRAGSAWIQYSLRLPAMLALLICGSFLAAATLGGTSTSFARALKFVLLSISNCLPPMVQTQGAAGHAEKTSSVKGIKTHDAASLS